MKVIITERFKNLGEVGEVVTVKNGYARNFLIPNKKVIAATKDNVAYFESRKDELKKASEVKQKEAEVIAKKLEGVFATIIKQAGDDGRLFGSVSSSEIADSTNAKAKTTITRKSVIISTPIKYIGIYPITVDIGAGVFAKVNVNISRSEAEAEEARAKFLRGEAISPVVSNEIKAPKAEAAPAAESAEQVA
jgi:large subunit ribosomal protein L9